jgi:hypothetical protein
MDEVLQIGFDANGNGLFIVGKPELEPGLYPFPATFTSMIASRYTLVDGVVTDAYPGQTDAEVVATQAAAAAAAAEAISASFPPPAVELTQLQVMDLFTLTEMAGIYTAADSNVLVEIWLDKLKAATFISLSDPQTIAGVEALVSAGLLTSDRATQILANQPAPVATPAPTATPAPSASATPVPSPTPTPAPTDTPSPTPTDTPTPTATPVPTATPTPTPDPTPSPSPMPTDTPAPTATPVPSPTPTDTPVATPAPTDTPVPSATPAPSVTDTPSPSPTPSPTPTPSST